MREDLSARSANRMRALRCGRYIEPVRGLCGGRPRTKECEHGNPRYASLYEDSSYPWTRRDPRRRFGTPSDGLLATRIKGPLQLPEAGRKTPNPSRHSAKLSSNRAAWGFNASQVTVRANRSARRRSGFARMRSSSSASRRQAPESAAAPVVVADIPRTPLPVDGASRAWRCPSPGEGDEPGESGVRLRLS